MSPDKIPGLRDNVRVLVIPGTDPVGDWMADVIRSEPDMVFLGLVRDLSQVPESLDRLTPDVILVDIGSGILQKGDLLNRLSAPASGAAVIVVAMMGEVDMVRQAMLYGAQGFLLKPFGEADLLSSVRQAFDLIVQRRKESPGAKALPGGTAQEPGERAEVVSIFSPKGGVGCTTLAINLAVALKAASEKPVTLVDGDLRFGDVDTALNITSATSIGTLLPQLDELDNQLLRRSLATHSSGIQVLSAPHNLDAADTIRPEELKRLLVRLAELDAGYLVVDTWSTLDDSTLAILDISQHVIVITTPQVTALRDVHRFMEVLDLLSYELDRTLLVLNHAYHRSEIKLQDMERALGYPIVQTIEYAPGPVTASLNRGVPLVLEYSDTMAAQNIKRLAQMLIERGARAESEGLRLGEGRARRKKAKKRGLFSWRGPAAARGVSL
ncbi:MAG: P-loop NTPase [Anaerolineae bacterium]|nr:P-loop NTPase [Anaerolineae bacterium]